MPLQRGLFVMMVVAGLVAACGDGTAAAQSSTGAPPPVAAAPVSVSAPSASSASTASWSSGPVEVVHHPTVPPVPVVTGVRYAAHPAEGFDRVVFDIEGAVPGYSVRYVQQVRADPSDRVVTVPGRRYLLVVLDPAQAHRADGSGTVSGVHRLDLPMVRGYAVVGDFEGHVSIALGLDATVGYRVRELSGRIYVDVAA